MPQTAELVRCADIFPSRPMALDLRSTAVLTVSHGVTSRCIS